MPANLKNCDIVMKGGITSGIVYPTVVCKLATQYQFKNLGGTSAGALSAALTTAAEYARQTGEGAGSHAFERLAEIPKWLGADSKFGGGSNLLRLFQPQPGATGLFRVGLSFLEKGLFKRLGAWLSVFWVELLVGILPVFGLAVLAALWARQISAVDFAIAILLAILSVAAAVILSIGAGLLIRVRRLPERHFGLCTGYGAPDPKQPLTLVHWLNDTMNALAGKPAAEPLTFGDLSRAGLNLKTITTCLTFGRPFSMPFDAGETFYYSPSEMRVFFPKEVVDWMERCSARQMESANRNERSEDPVDTTGFLPMPEGADLPVIVAARMSMSFPVLFCAVPLYAIDFTLRRRLPHEAAAPDVPGGSLGPKEPRRPERVWFSDGGITSNFPIHLFDSPLPRWPTFGLDLADVRPDRPDPADPQQKIRERVYMPKTNSAGISNHWTRLSTGASLGAFAGFFPSMLDSARNWMDNLQTSAPGYRDRVAHIALDPEEGGLNLNMPANIQKALADYGTEAAQRIVDHFIHGVDNGNAVRTTWDNHRWVRYRSTMGLVGRFLDGFASSIANPEPGDRSYIELIRREPGDDPKSYPLNAEEHGVAETFTQSLAGLGSHMDGIMTEGQPKPEPVLRVRPNF